MTTMYIAYFNLRLSCTQFEYFHIYIFFILICISFNLDFNYVLDYDETLWSQTEGCNFTVYQNCNKFLLQ